MEKIIKFPLPQYNEIFNVKEELIKKPFCICYQYDINENGYGPYGFNTNKSLTLLKKTFESLHIYVDGKIQKMNDSIAAFKNAIYLYNSENAVELLSKEINNYSIMVKKKEIFRRNQKEDIKLPEKPIILDVIKNDLFDVQILNQLLDKNINLFLTKYYAPEAGNSLVLFDDDIISIVQNISKELGVEYCEVTSINELKPW